MNFKTSIRFAVFVFAVQCIYCDTDVDENPVKELNTTLEEPQQPVLQNGTETGNTNTTTIKYVNCKDRNLTEIYENVELVDGKRLMNVLVSSSNITTREMPAECVLALFYTRSCPFSCQAAPHFNALARAYPNIKLIAIDAKKHHSSNAHFGIVSVPTIKLFHNGRPVGKYNGSEYTVNLFGEFVSALTGLQAQELLVRSIDFKGPVENELSEETDHFLIISWLFIILCGAYYFTQSRWWKYIIETIQSNWRDSAAQHQHAD